MSMETLVRDGLSGSLRSAGERLPSPEVAEFGARFARFGEARVVLLGEATHGTSEFYRARAAVSRELIERHGFNIVAVEADWPDAARIDRFVRRRGSQAGEERVFARFPSWMWRNREVHDFVDWLRLHNASRKDPVEFRGLDIYSLRASMAAVLAYLDRADPALAQAARERYGCLTPWQDDPARYGKRALYSDLDCEAEVVAQLRALLDRRLDLIAREPQDYFDAEQNARVVRSAEEYYRVMYHGAAESWNLRDRHMFDTLEALMRRRSDAKAIVWAHNSHVGNAAATAMGWQGEFNIGELCRTAYGDGCAAIGFGTDRGTVAAADEWDAPMRIKTVLPAREDSFEAAFRDAGLACSLTDWRTKNKPLRAELAEPRLERAIGVIYRPESELSSHYFRAVLAEQFDAFVWFEESRAITPLPGAVAAGALETYPFGL